MMLLTYTEWLKKIKETGASAGVPFVGQPADPGGEMSWQGAPSGGALKSAKGNVKTKKKKAK